MIAKGRFLIACSAAALMLGAACVPALAQGQTAHNLSRPMRHRPMMMHHHMRMHRPMMHHHHMMHRAM